MSELPATVPEQLIGWLRAFLPDLMKGILIALAGWYIAGKAKALLLRLGRRLSWEPTIAEYLSNTLRYAIVVLFLVSGLKQAGFPVNSLLAAVGISGVIVGLGVRAQIANYFAGVMMLAARPFEHGRGDRPRHCPSKTPSAGRCWQATSCLRT